MLRPCSCKHKHVTRTLLQKRKHVVGVCNLDPFHYKLTCCQASAFSVLPARVERCKDGAARATPNTSNPMTKRHCCLSPSPTDKMAPSTIQGRRPRSHKQGPEARVSVDCEHVFVFAVTREGAVTFSNAFPQMSQRYGRSPSWNSMCCRSDDESGNAATANRQSSHQ